MSKSIQQPDKTEGGDSFASTRNISLWIDTYDDIFSDFDPRNYEERSISDDFLSELKKYSGEKEPVISDLTLLIPKNSRNSETETIIAKRLNQYFKKSYHSHLYNKNKERKKGIFLTVAGTALMVVASFISFKKSDEFMMHTLLVLTEPAGWFMMWSGLDTLFNSTGKALPEFTFYTKLIKTKITFVEY